MPYMPNLDKNIFPAEIEVHILFDFVPESHTILAARHRCLRARLRPKPAIPVLSKYECRTSGAAVQPMHRTGTSTGTVLVPYTP